MAATLLTTASPSSATISIVEACLEVLRGIARRCLDEVSAAVAGRPEPSAATLSFMEAARIATNLAAWELRCIAYGGPRMAGAQKLTEFQSILTPLLARLANETGILDGAPAARAQVCADIFVPYYLHAAGLVALGTLSKQAFAERLADIAQLVQTRTD